jgi:integrase
MGRIFRPTKPLLDAQDNPVLDEHGKIKRVPRTQNWYIRYYDANGKQCDEATGSAKKGDAKRLLHEREAAKGRGELIVRERWTFDAAMQAVIANQTLKDRRSVSDTERRIRLHLAPYFSGRLMMQIDSDAINRYALARKEAGAKPATINRELAILKRAFRLGLRGKKLTSVPYIDPLDESDNVRTDFWEREPFEAVRALLPEYLRGLVTVYFWAGWRKMELLTLEVRQVTISQNTAVVELEPWQTKNKTGRRVDFSDNDEVRDALTAQIASAERISRERGRIVTTVFHHPDGEPITKDQLRKPWERARAAAGYPTKTLHAFRRTATRNYSRSGVVDTVSMKITGHKTRSMFDRYNITSDADVRQAGQQVSAYVLRRPIEKQTGQVRQFKRQADR